MGPSRVFLSFDLAHYKDFRRPRVFHLDTEIIVKQGFGVLWCGSKASLYCIFRDGWKKFENRSGLSKHLKNTGPRAGTVHKQHR